MVISIIIPTLNRAGSLHLCLERIKENSLSGEERMEVIVIDSSDDNSSEIICKEFNFSQYLKSKLKNRSFQRNLGLKKAKGEVIAFLDDDCFVRDSWLVRLSARFKKNNIDILGGVVFDQEQEVSRFHGTEFIGRVFDNGMTIANFMSPINRMVEVDWLPGGNMAFRREVFNRIAGFDVSCIGTAGYEETDLCIRAQKAGYKLFFDPQIAVDHVRGERFDIGRDRKEFRGRYYAGRNYTYFLLKNFGVDFRKLFFIYFKETYWQVLLFLRKPGTANLTGIFANISGKVFGTLLALKYHFVTKNKEKPLLKCESE